MNRSTCLVVGALLVSSSASSYDETNHSSMTAVALKASQLATDTAKRARIGLARPIEDSKLKFSSSKGVPGNILDLVTDGAKFEDEGITSLHHFFNPVTGSALQVPARPNRFPFDWLPAGISAINQYTVASPDWALLSTRNAFNLKQLKAYYYAGLVSAKSTERDRNLGLAFESLGRIVHHIEDMAQPQHVRNDVHWYEEKEENCDPVPQLAFLCDAYKELRARSTYEQWTKELKLDYSDFATYGPPYDATRQLVALPGDFWIGAGRGLADFTNRNFLSAGTMLTSPPAMLGDHDELASDLCRYAKPACEVQDLDHVVTFWHNYVDDLLDTSKSTTNQYAAAASIFEWDFRSIAPNAKRPYVGNRFTFDANHQLLLPRAIGYVTGFVNYIFRGDFELALPEEGVFAVVDVHPDTCGDNCGFRTVKLKVRNITSNEAVRRGELILVAKHRMNTCFKRDLSGEDGGSAFSSLPCRSQEDFVVVSDPVKVEAIGRAWEAPIKFVMSNLSRIPISATDLSFQVIFRGKLGEEEDAIVVSTLDVSEPNYVAVGNLTDYVFYEGDDRYSPLRVGDYPITLNTVSFSFKDPTSAPPLATVTSLGGGQHAQFAFITTKGSPRFWLRTQSSPPFGYTDNAPFRVEEFFRDDYDDKSTYARTCQVVLERGQYRQYSMYYAQTSHGRFSEAAPGGTFSAVRPNGQPSVAKYAADCRGSVAPGTNGLLDLSYLTPYNAANAKSWTINFP